MPEDVLTSESEQAAPPAPETVAAREAAPHDVAPPEPEPAEEPTRRDTPPVPEEEPPANFTAAEEPPAAPPAVEEEAPQAVQEAPAEEAAAFEPADEAEESAAPPAPPHPQSLAPAVHREEEPAAGEEGADPEAAAEPEPDNKRWYVVKVQSGREETIKEAIERRVKIERLEEFFGEIKIPVERVTEMRKSKRVVKERKLFPGYLMANVEYNDHIFYLFRETSGVGDFVGGTLNRPPPPMSPREVERMLGGPNKGDAKGEKVVEVKPQFDRGDRVKVRDGTFAGMEGEVKDIIEAKNQVKVELTIFGRPVPVELEYWQVEIV